MRFLFEVADDIMAAWPKVHPHAAPYLRAMSEMRSIHDVYYFDPGREIVLKFLGNARTFRGEEARRLKAELRSMLYEVRK